MTQTHNKDTGVKALRIARAQLIRDLLASPDSSPFIDSSLLYSMSIPVMFDARGLSKSINGANGKLTNVTLTSRDSIAEGLAKAQLGVRPTILIFGSARRPGGGWDKGAKAQEEDVALHSTWGVQAEQAGSYYALSKADNATAMNPDLLLWVERGAILAQDLYQLLASPVPCSFLAFAAPNATGLASQGVKVESQQVQALLRHHMEVRCAATLLLAEQNKVEHLILGAIGCGVFGLNPEMVAKTWQRVIAATGYDKPITFALPSGPNSLIGITFKEAFKQDFLGLDNQAVNAM